ncbi:unnamed protein product [Malus baccata var. baccata]
MIWYAFCLLFQGYLSKSVYAERDGTLSMVLGFERRVLISLDDAAKPLKHFEKGGKGPNEAVVVSLVVHGGPTDATGWVLMWQTCKCRTILGRMHEISLDNKIQLYFCPRQ